MLTPVLRFDDVSLRYPSRGGVVQAVENLHLDAMEGEFVSVVGPSGCGKSTLLNIACGVLPATSGEVILRGLKVTSIVQDGMGYVFQTDAHSALEDGLRQHRPGLAAPTQARSGGEGPGVSGNRAFLLHDLATEKETLWLYDTYYPFTALVTRPEVIQKKPDLVQRMVNAVLQAHAYIQESDATPIASTLPAEFRSNQEVYLKSLAHSKETLAPTGVLTTESLEAVLKWMIQSEVLAAGTQIDVASVLDMSFVEKATASK